MKNIGRIIFNVCFVLSIVGFAFVQPGFAYDAEKEILTYAHIVYLSYNDSYEKAGELNNKVKAFLDDPTEENLKGAKAAWLKAREPYGQTEAYRFYGGPIDFVNQETGIEGPESRLNSWPLDEAYIDYVRDNPHSGIVNNLEIELTEESLVKRNIAEDEDTISTGYHAIEFLLWGQDFNADTPGNRPTSDYEKGDPIKERRRQYLQIVTDLLVKDLKSLVEQWRLAENEENFAAVFTKADQKEDLSKILTGLATLSGFELASERMATPLDSGDQEDEHSCFSDNTHNDFLNNALGLRNVYLGEFGLYKGEGLTLLVAQVDPSLDRQIKSNLEQTIEAIKAIPAPIDLNVLARPAGSPGRKKMEKAVRLLQRQADLFKDAGGKLGVKVDIVRE